MAANSASPPNTAQRANAQANPLIQALGNAFKTQTGGEIDHEQIAKLLHSNIGRLSQLAQQGQLTTQQIAQLKEFADRHRSGVSLPPQVPAQQPAQAGFKAAVTSGPALGSDTSQNAAAYPISDTLNTTNPGPVQWQSSQQGRPTLTGGISGGRMSGTPAQVTRGSDDVNMLNLDDHRSRRKNTPGDQSMRRSIQDLVSSVDPNVKIDAEVEDLLLTIADEFIDSVTNFACRLTKHRQGDTLEVRDLQLHLERNHNIRIPGFASDETRISLSQSSVAPAVPATGNAKKSGGQQGTQMTLRSHRLAQVAQAKREAKLI